MELQRPKVGQEVGVAGPGRVPHNGTILLRNSSKPKIAADFLIFGANKAIIITYPDANSELGDAHQSNGVCTTWCMDGLRENTVCYFIRLHSLELHPCNDSPSTIIARCNLIICHI